MARKIPLRRLKKLLHYDPNTGFWTRLLTRPGWPAGRRAGHLHHTGYRSIGIDGHYYAEHQLAWFYMTGKWPTRDIDHKNSKPADNEWKNLRLATESQNAANMRTPVTNKSGYKGVHFHKKCKKYRARIYILGRGYSLGLHNTAYEAHLAYAAASKKLHGQFSRAA